MYMRKAEASLPPSIPPPLPHLVCIGDQEKSLAAQHILVLCLQQGWAQLLLAIGHGITVKRILEALQENITTQHMWWYMNNQL